MSTKFGMEDYWISSLLGIAFGDNTFIANLVIATVLHSYLSVLEKDAYLVSHQFPRCRRHIMISLQYLPYYWKLFNHIWQLYTLGVGKFFHALKFDLSSLSRLHDQKIVFWVHPPVIAAHQNLLTAETCNYTHMFILSKTRAD